MNLFIIGISISDLGSFKTAKKGTTIAKLNISETPLENIRIDSKNILNFLFFDK